MATRQLPDAELLRKLLRYDPETGKLYWRSRSPEMFKDDRQLTADGRSRQWNTRYAGKEALAAKHAKGYLHGSVGGYHLLAHRVIWLIMTGERPPQIDHINHIRNDNRFLNLEASDKDMNPKNQSRRKGNRSGVTGVKWVERDSRWTASISDSGRLRHLGNFKRKEDAVRARKAAERRLGFHPNHGSARA